MGRPQDREHYKNIYADEPDAAAMGGAPHCDCIRVRDFSLSPERLLRAAAKARFTH
jgi:hypothetical protein